MEKQNESKIIIYTDGGCIGNPGPGGYGAVVLQNGERRELSSGFRLTTNNRMELMAAIAGLKSTPDTAVVTLYSDSRYLVDGMTRGWVQNWRAKGWRRAGNVKVPNVDLWKQLLDLTAHRKVSFVWVEGHTGVRENERCDQLSGQAAKGKNLPQDDGYETGTVSTPALF